MIKKTALYLILILIVMVLAGYLLLGKESVSQNNLIHSETGNGDFQKITLGAKNLNYYPNTIKVEYGKPVRIYLDSGVTGCFRSFTIRDFGVAKYLKTPNDYVEFTPTKKGSFRFSCSMGMGTGTLVVE